MISTPSFGALPWLQALRPIQSDVVSFWQAEHVDGHVNNLRETLDLLKAVQTELEGIHLIKRSSQNNAEGNQLSTSHISDHSFSPSSNDSILTDVSQLPGNGVVLQFSETVKEKRISLTDQESFSLEAARSLFSTLRNQLASLSVVTCQTSSWEEKSVAIRLAQKLQKSKRNKRWKKRKRKQVAELLRKEHKDYDRADQEADEWRTREIAKDIAKRKVESMKEIAKFKANEERKRLESELELVLVVEKLQELRSIRIQKLKKQGHFFPEEDDKFLERVRAAVEEEERQVAVAADTDVAKDAIATAEESRNAIQYTSTELNDINQNNAEVTSNLDKFNVMGSERSSCMEASLEPERQKVFGQWSVGGYDSVANLSIEFYHYYHGSSNDLGTLVEVRRTWDAYIRPGGSRIPGHWVPPPPPADEVWASYLVCPK